MSWEINNHVANGIALVASFLVIVMWLAPVRDVWTAKYSIFRTKSTENVATGFGYVSGVFNCLLWDMYAINRLDTMVVPFIVNCVGFALNVSFVICYWYYASLRQARAMRYQFFALVFFTIAAIGVWVYEGNNNMVGYFAAFVNILMFFGPLAAAGDVIRARNTRGMSLLPMIMTLFSSMVWFIYGVYIKEIPAMIPNGLGMVFGVAQLILYAWAKRQEKKTIPSPGLVPDSFRPVSDSSSVSSQGSSDDMLRERSASLLENGTLRERSSSSTAEGP